MVVERVHSVQGVSVALTGLAFTGLAFTGLAFAATLAFGRGSFLLHLAKLAKIVFGSLERLQMLEWSLSGEASSLGEIRKVSVDSKVHRNIVNLALVRVHISERQETPTSNMLEHNMIELML
jgi:hypothetical protein